MTSFVIRSMSTTDYVVASRGQPAQKPVPYHVYLMRPELRSRAWWNRSMHDAMKFDTHAEALDYVEARFDALKDAEISAVDADTRGLPTFWDNQLARTEARLRAQAEADNAALEA
jgi:hypothetical protein